MPKVRFLNEAITVEVPSGSSLKDAADKAGVNLFEGFWTTYHCSGSGRCLGSGCRVWATPSTPSAVNARTFWERIRPTHRGAIRLACQVQVHGDVDVRTQPGTLEFRPSSKWDPDPRHFKWQERLTASSPPGSAKAEKE